MSAGTLASIRELSANGRYSDALREIENAEAAGMLSPTLLVWKARILQLVEDDGSLDEVEKTLQRAVELDATCAEAYLELAWFRLNVQNDSKLALECFQSVLRLLIPTNTEAITGLLKCIQELEPGTDLHNAKSQAVLRLVDETKLEESLRN